VGAQRATEPAARTGYNAGVCGRFGTGTHAGTRLADAYSTSGSQSSAMVG